MEYTDTQRNIKINGHIERKLNYSKKKISK